MNLTPPGMMKPLAAPRFGMALEPFAANNLDGLEQSIQDSARRFEQRGERLKEEILTSADERFQQFLNGVGRTTPVHQCFVDLATVLKDVQEQALRRIEEAGGVIDRLKLEVQGKLNEKAEETTTQLINTHQITPHSALHYLIDLKELDFVVSNAVSVPLLRVAQKLMTASVQDTHDAAADLDLRRQNPTSRRAQS